jgi:hypothetical protein
MSGMTGMIGDAMQGAMPGNQYGIPPAGIQGGPADLQYPGEVSAPGMGGKGGMPLDGIKPNPFSQVPVDMQGNLLQPGANDNLPQVPPMMTPQSGTPGRPVPVADFTPRGPGFANPGGGGVVKDPMPQVPGQGAPGMGGKGPVGAVTNALQNVRPAVQPMPTPAPIVNPRARVSRQPVQSMKQGGMTRASRGAGRGGMLR